MAIDPNHDTTTVTTPATAVSTTPTTTSTTTRPIRPASSPAPPHPYTAHGLPIRTQSPSASPVAAAAAHHNQGVLYPVASSGRGFIPRPIRPTTTVSGGGEHRVTVANAGGPGAAYSSRPSINFPPQLPLPQYLMRPTYSLAPSPLPPSIKGQLPHSSTPEVAPPSSVPDSNGFKDIRDKSRDDNLAAIRGRKVRMTDGASLYVHCRSWLRNGFPEESQPRYGDAVRSLPKPSPIPMASATVAKKAEEEKEESNEDQDKEYIEHLSPRDLLKRHVKRARRVRARLREERLRRIARYKSRLALLLPPLVEQFRNDVAAGN